MFIKRIDCYLFYLNQFQFKLFDSRLACKSAIPVTSPEVLKKWQAPFTNDYERFKIKNMF